MTRSFSIYAAIYMQGSYFSSDTKYHVFSRLFLGKSNEIPGQFDFESQWLCL